MASYKITLTTTNWTSVAEIYYDTASGLFYADVDLQNEIGNVEPATRELYRFNGWFNSSSGTTQYIDEKGDFTDVFRTKCASVSTGFTIYAQGTQVSYKLTLNDNSGSGGLGALYFPIGGGSGNFYTDYLCSGEPLTSVTKPTYTNKIFKGYYNGTSTPGNQYFDKDGDETDSLRSLVLTGAKTIYAGWQNPVEIAVSAQNGIGGTTKFYRDPINDKWSLDKTFKETISSITMHTRECYEHLGCYNSTSGTTQYVNANGVISTSWEPQSSITIYCKWNQVSYKVLVSKQSGSGGLDAFFVRKGVTPHEVYADDLCRGDILTQIDVPRRSEYTLNGLFYSSSGGTKYVNRDGSFEDAFFALSITGNKTFYAVWKSVYKMTLSDNGGSGGSGKLYYDPIAQLYFRDPELTIEASSVTPPTKLCYAFTGYFSASSGGTKYINSDGSFTSDMMSLDPTGNKTFTAHWELVAYTVTLDARGGSGGPGAIYFSSATPHETWYGDDLFTTQISSITPPSRDGYTFIGYYTATSGGSLYIQSDGTFRVLPTELTGNTKFYARWSANAYTLSFDYAGGSGSVVSKSVTFASTVGSLPTPNSRQDAVFDGWYLNGVKISDTSVYSVAGNATAVANWRFHFGNLVDYFSLASNAKLLLVSSESGTGRQVTNLWNGAYEQGSSLLNPVCVFRIKSSGNITIQLGKAFRSGYMITELEYKTGADQEPTLTVRGVANEGANAINLYSVTLAVDPCHIAQDPFNAITSGGGELVEMTSAAKCDPVVPYENNAPCASDVVHGRIVVSGRTNAYFGESAPSIGNSFIDSGVPSSESDVDFTSYAFSAEKSI